jgi:hypothetical protein
MSHPKKNARLPACEANLAMIPYQEYATCIMKGPKATIYTCTGGVENMQVTPHINGKNIQYVI